ERGTRPTWLGSNCWVRDGAVGERRERQGGPRSPFSLRRLGDPVGLEAPRADAQPPRGPVHYGPHALQVRIPAPVRLVVRVADVVPCDGALATNLTNSSHEACPAKACAQRSITPHVRAGSAGRLR